MDIHLLFLFKHGNNVMTITWNDGHVSTYTYDWLYKRRFTEEAREERQKWMPLAPKLWGRKQMQDNVPTDSFENVIRPSKS